jgi:Helix-turn-helix domain
MTGHTVWKDVRNRRTGPAAAEFEDGAAIRRARLQFAVTLRELRDRRDTRQGTLAERLHVSQANVSRIRRLSGRMRRCGREIGVQWPAFLSALLIQAAVGSAGGRGGRRTKRSGVAA